MTICAVRAIGQRCYKYSPNLPGEQGSCPGLAWLCLNLIIPICQLGYKTYGAETHDAVFQSPPGPALAAMGGLSSRGLLTHWAPQSLTYS